MTGGREAIAPVLVLALDGATFDVIDPLIASGRLPNLAAWKRDGAAHALRSTVPAASFPARCRATASSLTTMRGKRGGTAWATGTR